MCYLERRISVGRVVRRRRAKLAVGPGGGQHVGVRSGHFRARKPLPFLAIFGLDSQWRWRIIRAGSVRPRSKGGRCVNISVCCMELHPILAAVALVIQMKAGSPIGTASGFFFRFGSNKFFVTNKHVVAGDPQKPQVPKPDTIRLRLHTDAKNIQKSDWLSIALYTEAGSKVWKEHPSADVAMIPLKDEDVSHFFVTWIQPSDYLPSDLVIFPGDDVFIIGYPEAFYDSTNNLPVFRNAFIATAYGVPFKGLPLFLTDARLHPGMSGSPVFTKPKNTWVDAKGNTQLRTGVSYFLLGIHSGTVEWPPATQDPLGLGAAWYASVLDEIVASK